MFSQFRAQYPQGSIQTEMLPKIDGLHAFRAIVSQGDAIMGTATAVDSDLEIAEDRAIKRALTIAGISFEHSFEGYGDYTGRSPILTQVSREPTTINSLASAHFQPQLESMATVHTEPSHGVEDIKVVANNFSNNFPNNSANSLANNYDSYTDYGDREVARETPRQVEPNPSPVLAPMTTDPIDLSDAISKIDVEMDRLGWTKKDGRDYLLRNFDKKTRQELTNHELGQFLNHLKSLPSPMRQSSNPANEEFF